MRMLMVLIIAGLALLSLGSPDKVERAGREIFDTAVHLPERANQPTPMSGALASNNEGALPASVPSPNFSNPPQQPDIPASKVLHGPVITPETKTSILAGASDPTSPQANDTPSNFDQIQSLNVATGRILDQITATNP
jgi:hypothetical protein